jgi:diketogulonate reductase-like aldo/keto reductase
MKKITDIGGTFKLHNNVEMPYLGLGTYQADNDDKVVDAVKYALDIGYRHIDTAAAYQNEKGVGKGIVESPVNREDVFVTSKVWNSDQGYDSTIRAFEASVDRLGFDYLDLYLIHWPVAGKYKDTWRALEKLYKEKRIRAIGVSNFMRHHLEDLLEDAEVVPAVNQMEFHPYLVQQELIDFCDLKGIQYESWSPFLQGELFDLEITKGIEEKYDKTAAQVILRWNLQKGVIAIPKSVHEKRIQQNADIFDFELTEGEIDYLDNLDQGKRTGPDPDNFDF